MAADNVFGFTFEESKKQAQNSLQRIDVERADQLRDTSKFTTTWKSWYVLSAFLMNKKQFINVFY